MATVTELGETWNTTAGNKTVVATPTDGALIVVVHGMSGWASGDTSDITDNDGGVYEFPNASAGGGTSCALWISIRTTLITTPISTTFTCTNVGDTGGGLTVLQVTGMTRTGLSAIRQNTAENFQTESPVQAGFSAAVLTGNPVILGCMGEDNPAALTPPTGFTETTDTGWATPATGIHVCYASSGLTASSFTYAAGAFTDHNETGIELDSTVPGGIIFPPRHFQSLLTR